MPEPTEQTEQTEQAKPTNEEQAFGDIFRDFNLTAAAPSEEKPEEQEAKPPEVKPTEETPGADEAPKVAATEEEAPKPAVVEPKPPVVEAAPEEKPSSVKTDAERLAEFKEKRAALIERILPSYSFTEEQVAQYEEKPLEFLKRMAAENYVNTFEGVSQVIRAQLPALISAAQAARTTESSANEDFFKAFPALNKPEYEKTIHKVTTAFRQLNPNDDINTVIKNVGMMASVQLGLPIPNGAPPKAAENKKEKKGPVQPANPGATGAVATPVSDNLFAQLAEDFKYS